MSLFTLLEESQVPQCQIHSEFPIVWFIAPYLTPLALDHRMDRVCVWVCGCENEVAPD